ncbi:MAG TPA: EAL domain-containing protein [Acidimicrobiales bacterium]|nr:EAL domain-containing protein [Acidimicrobiales bacterium]HRA33528.1 EAL domain-containing protein [Acidimicrobiales bacterium]
MPWPVGVARSEERAAPSVRRELAFTVAAVVAYLGAAYWARFVSIPGPVLVWFPPAGLAVGVLYLRPRLFPLLVAAEVVSTAVVMDLADEFGPVGLVVNALVIVGAYHLAGETLRRLRFDPRMRSSDDLLVLAFSCLVVGAGVAAVAGVLVQTAVDLVQPDDIARSMGLFWVGDVIACASLTPAVVMVGDAFLRGRPPPLADDEWKVNHWLLVVEYVIPSVAAVFLMAIGDEPMRFVYLAFVPVVGLAVRHGVAAAALSSAALGAVLSAGAHELVTDPLARSDIQLLMVVLTLTGIMVGAVVSARRDVLVATQQISDIVEATPDLVATAYADGRIRYLNPVGRALLGTDTSDPDVRAFDFMPDDLAADLMREGMRSAERFGTWSGENRLRRIDGRVIPVSQVLVAHRPPDGGPVTFSTVCRDMTDQRLLEDQLRRAALYDEVTGLPNRALLEDQLIRLVGTAEPARRTAVMFADVDHLQRVNETFGFKVGDDVVNTVSDRLAELIRGADLLARYGGAQFAVVLPDVSDEFEPILFANRMLACFADPMDIDGRRVRVTGSVGIAITNGGADVREALRSAEIALHRAKEAGGGRFALFDQDLESRAQQRMVLEADLREALETRSWWLAYQPIVDTESREVTGAEALLRFTHPLRGPVSPYELIRLAEHSGAILELGREILTRACTEAVEWHRHGHPISISVNVSALQLRDPGFVADVVAAVERTGIAADRLVIELTETTLATDEHGEIENLQALRALGCQIALDDFGTGFSSLSGLRDLPIDVVKLDRSFITNLTTSAEATALVDAVVHIAQALELTVVAEGVETVEQYEALAALHCHRIQGYAVSHPITPDELGVLLGNGHQIPARPT